LSFFTFFFASIRQHLYNISLSPSATLLLHCIAIPPAALWLASYPPARQLLQNLNPVMLQKLQKLHNAASLAIVDSNLQRTTNVDLIVAEKTKKKRANRQKGKQYAYSRVLNEETITEREAFCKFRDYWQRLSRIQPNLLGKPAKKNPSKKLARS
jgi:hypothetical protein